MAKASAIDRYASVRLEIEEASAFDGPFVMMNVLATVVACYGLLADSVAAVIGAMILAMMLDQGLINGHVGVANDDDARWPTRATPLAEQEGCGYADRFNRAINAATASQRLHRFGRLSRPNQSQ